MRTIKQSSAFKSDLKREATGPHRVALAKGFVDIVATLAKDEPLAKKHRDHALTGDWKDHRLHQHVAHTHAISSRRAQPRTLKRSSPLTQRTSMHTMLAMTAIEEATWLH